MSPAPSAPRDEEEILVAVRALQNGAGQDAFGVIFRHFYRPLFRFFANQPALREEAEDLTQVTLFRAYEKIDQYRFEASFSAWVRQIGENVWKNAVRARQAAKRALLGEAREPAAGEAETGGLSTLGDGVRDE